MPWNHWHCMAGDALGLIDRAREFGVDGLILEFAHSNNLPTHGWNWSFDDLALYDGIAGLRKTGEAREFTLRCREGVARIIREAGSKGIRVYVMGPELSFRPEALRKMPDLLDPAKDLMYQLPAKRLAEIFDALPGLAGIKLFLDEGEVNINEIDSPVPPVDRVHRLITSMLEVCRQKDRALIVTTFSLMPHQANAIREALLRIPPDEHLVVDNYVCPGDWGRIRLFSPMIGNVGGHPEQINFDYCGEVWGQSVVPLCQARFIKESLDRARRRGANVAGISGYITWIGNALGTPNESSVHAASRIAAGDAREPDEIILEWAERRYGAEAAPAVASALAQTWDIVMKSWHDLGFWVHELPKSEIADIGWYNLSLHMESLAVWDESYRETARMLQNPTETTVAAVVAEKDEAVRLARQALAEVHWQVPWRSDSDYQELRRFFEREHIMCQIFRAYSEGFYRTRMWYGGDTSQEHLVCRRVHDLRHLADQLETELDEGFWICRPERVRTVARELEEILEGAAWPNPTYEGLTADEWTERYRKLGYPV